LFFLAAVGLFYAGSARYLLPLAPAVALLLVDRLPSRPVFAAALALHFVLGLALAESERQYADGYRAIVEKLEPLAGSARIWSNAEWGLRHYLGRIGG